MKNTARRIFGMMCTLALAALLVHGQATGSSGGTSQSKESTAKTSRSESGKKATKTSKAHKGGKKSKKSAGSTDPPPCGGTPGCQK